MRAAIALILILAPVSSGFAQEPPAPAQTQKPTQQQGSQASQQKSNTKADSEKPQKVDVGAGTRDSTTTGSSGSKASHGTGKPPQPGPTLCKSYQGTVQQDCLATVLRSDNKTQPAGATGPQQNPSSSPGNNNGG